MRRLKRLLGDRPIFFGSSRKRFLRNILEKSAALTAELTSDSFTRESTSSVAGSGNINMKGEGRGPTVEELDWATAGTTVAAVSGMLCYAISGMAMLYHAVGIPPDLPEHMVACAKNLYIFSSSTPHRLLPYNHLNCPLFSSLL